MAVGIALGGSILSPANLALAAPTSCSSEYDWAQQWTANSQNSYQPGSGCPAVDAYFGWVGIDGAMKTPPHFPNLATDGRNHSVGWLNMLFLTNSQYSWLQVGWMGGCGGGLCFPSSGGIGLYDEMNNVLTGVYNISNDGALGYSSTDIYRIEYYSDVQCWEVFKGYSYLLRSECGTFPTSGAAQVGSEVNNHFTPGAAIEMPYTIYGSSNPNTNSGLRIKGGNGYVAWTPSLSTGGTAAYDERNCPNPSYCPSPSPTYYVSAFYPSYMIEGYGNTS